MISRRSAHFKISTPELEGSINLKGARIDDLSLRNYRESIDPGSPDIVLLSPAGSAAPHPAYYAEFSWLAAIRRPQSVPTADTRMESGWRDVVARASAQKLSWDNGKGLAFERTIAVDDHFMFRVTDHVRNSGAQTATLYPFGLIRAAGQSHHARHLGSA